MSFSDDKLKIRSAADLVTAVPYLIGFHPGEGSIVVIACRDGRVVFAARGDLPDPGGPPSHTRDLANRMVPVVRQQQPITDVMIVGYGEAGHVGPPLRTVQEAFTASGVPIRALLRVTDARVFNLNCHNPACCPPQGTPFDPTASLVAAQATAAGLVALPDRAAVAARFAPVEGAARDGMHRATNEAGTRLKSLRTAVHEAGTQAVRDALRQHDTGAHLTDDEMAWLTLLLEHPSVRDLAVELTQPHDRHVTFWAEVTRRAEEPLVPAPATLLAVTAWRCGDGALAAMAAERALQVDPAYQLAGLLLQALHAGLPPSAFDQAVGGDRTGPDEQTSIGEP